MDKIQVEISSDRLEAYFVLNIHSKEETSLEEIKKILEENKIVQGILWEDIEKALDEKNFGNKILIARGLPPKEGKDAELERKIKLDRKPTPREIVDGRVDHYNIDLIINIEKDAVIIRKIPATKGEHGLTVTGEPIYAPNGHDLPFPQGDGTYVSSDNLELRASLSGYVFESLGKICVEPVLNIKGDVNFSTGNIDFIGSVVINGNVRSKFKVVADDDIIILGNVEAAEVMSRKGNIIIEGGIKGGKKAVINAAGSISAKFAEFCSLYAGEGIIIEDSLFHSEVETREKISLCTGKGIIIGGRIKVGRNIMANIIGSKSFVFTEIVMATQKQSEILKNVSQLEKEINEKNVELRRLQRDPKKSGVVNAILSQISQIKSKIESFKKDLNETMDNRIVINQIIYPGISLNMVGENMEIDREYNKIILCKDSAFSNIKFLKE